MLLVGAPSSGSPFIQQLCARLVPGSSPIDLAVTPAAGATEANCFIEVDERIRNEGGSACLGWAIWETQFVFLEVEAHALWRDASGVLHDITPKKFGLPRVLFLPDPNLKYLGRQIQSRFVPLSDNAHVTAMIEAQAALFDLMNRGDRADQHGEIVFLDDEAVELRNIQYRLAMATIGAAEFANAERARRAL
ncbi:MAG: hypothetical protein ABI548_02825 [Polyangiaceae bacterium]